MNRFFFTHMLITGLVFVLVIRYLLGKAARFSAFTRILYGTAMALAVPPLVFYGSTLETLPLWASGSWLVIASIVATVLHRRGRGAVRVALSVGAYTVFHTWFATWLFWSISPGCAEVLAQPGARRLDADADSSLALFKNRGEYAIEVDPEERYAYASYAHRGFRSGITRLRIDGSGPAAHLEVGSRGILKIRFDPSTRRILATDHIEGRLYVLGEEPFRVLDTIELGAREPMDLTVDVPAGRLLVIDRSEAPHAADPADRFAGLLVLDLAEPSRRLGRISLDGLPGANEIIRVLGEHRLFVTSEGFITLFTHDLTTHTSRLVHTLIPGIGGGAVDTARRELYLTHTTGLIQVRNLDTFAYERTLFVRGARAVALDATRGALYVSDFMNGRVVRIDPNTGESLGVVRSGVRVRQMKVLRDGRLVTAGGCGIVVLEPPGATASREAHDGEAPRAAHDPATAERS